MMNNVHYMVKTVEGSAELMLLGEEWLERHKVGTLSTAFAIGYDGVQGWGV